MPDLVVVSLNGKQSLRIDHFGPSKEPTQGTEQQRIAISDGEAALGLKRLQILYEGGAFK